MRCKFCGLPTVLHFARCQEAREAGLPEPARDFVRRQIIMGPYEWMRTKTPRPAKIVRS